LLDRHCRAGREQLVGPFFAEPLDREVARFGQVQHPHRREHDALGACKLIGRSRGKRTQFRIAVRQGHDRGHRETADDPARVFALGEPTKTVPNERPRGHGVAGLEVDTRVEGHAVGDLVLGTCCPERREVL
jgi:hypothetical protein